MIKSFILLAFLVIFSAPSWAQETVSNEEQPLRLKKPHALGISADFPNLLSLNYRYQVDEHWAIGPQLSWQAQGIQGRYYLEKGAFSPYIAASALFHPVAFLPYNSAPYLGLHGRYGLESRSENMSLGMYAGLGTVLTLSNRHIWGVFNFGVEGAWHF